MVPNTKIYPFVFDAKEKFSMNASTSQIETSNGKDEENAAQARVYPLPTHVATQRGDVPACRTA
jgi:hypothetical protein